MFPEQKNMQYASYIFYRERKINYEEFNSINRYILRNVVHICVCTFSVFIPKLTMSNQRHLFSILTRTWETTLLIVGTKVNNNTLTAAPRFILYKHWLFTDHPVSTNINITACQNLFTIHLVLFTVVSNVNQEYIVHDEVSSVSNDQVSIIVAATLWRYSIRHFPMRISQDNGYFSLRTNISKWEMKILLKFDYTIHTPYDLLMDKFKVHFIETRATL